MDSIGQSFVKRLDPYLDLWKAVDIRLQAVRHPRIGWKSECLRAVLVPTKRRIRERDLPRGPEIMVTHEVWPIDRLKELIAFLEAGELPIAGEKIAVKQPAGNSEWQPLPTFHVRTYGRSDAYARYGIDFKSLVLSGYGSSERTPEAFDIQERIDAKLQDSDPPWDGVAHLRRSFIGLPTAEAERQDLEMCDVVAPLPLKFGSRTAFTQSEIILDIERSPTVDASSVRVSVFLNFGDEIIDTERVSFDEPERKGRLMARRRVRGPCSGAKCALIYRGFVTDHKQLFRIPATEDPRWSAFHAFVGGPEDLNRALLETDGGDPLEHAVSTLFHLLGFATEHFGQKTFRTAKGTSDILAFSPDGEVCLVIECTTGEPDLAGKIGKLATRTKNVEESHPGAVVQAVFVTRQTRAEFTKTATNVAADERMAVVTSDDFDGLVGLATSLPRMESVLRYLTRLIPTAVER